MSRAKEIIALLPTPTRKVKLALLALWTLLFLWLGWWARGVYEEAQEAAQLRTAVKHEQKQSSAGAEATMSGQSMQAAAQAKNDGETHEAKARIERVYVRVPVPADCAIPDGVRSELAAAQERANRSVRAAAAAAGARDP